jgi:tRNA dimethylallyltransferase
MTDVVIADIVKRGKTPILVGGSGLYIDAVIKDYNLPEQSIDPTLRQNLNKLTVSELQAMLQSKDPQTFTKLNNSDQNNPRRLIRLIEKYEHRKHPSSDTEHKADKYNVTFYYPEYTLEDLYAKIDKRVLEMFDQGLLSETKHAISNGYENAKALQSFGYKEAISFLKGEIDKKACIESIQREHRRYAKRQITWFEGEGRGYKLIRFNF